MTSKKSENSSDPSAELVGEKLELRLKRLEKNGREPEDGFLSNSEFILDRIPEHFFPDGQLTPAFINVNDWSVTWLKHCTDELDALLGFDGRVFVEVKWGYGLVKIPVEIIPQEEIRKGKASESEKSEAFKFSIVHSPDPPNYSHALVKARRVKDNNGKTVEELLDGSKAISRGVKKKFRQQLMAQILERRNHIIMFKPHEVTDSSGERKIA